MNSKTDSIDSRTVCTVEIGYRKLQRRNCVPLNGRSDFGFIVSLYRLSQSELLELIVPHMFPHFSLPAQHSAEQLGFIFRYFNEKRETKTNKKTFSGVVDVVVGAR